MIIGLFVIASGAASRVEGQAVLRAQSEASVDAAANLEVSMVAGVRTDTQAGSEAGATMSAFRDPIGPVPVQCVCRHGTKCEHDGETLVPQEYDLAPTDRPAAMSYKGLASKVGVKKSDFCCILAPSTTATYPYPAQLGPPPVLLYGDVHSFTVPDDTPTNQKEIGEAIAADQQPPEAVFSSSTHHMMNLHWAKPGATQEQLAALGAKLNEVGGLKGSLVSLQNLGADIIREDDSAPLLANMVAYGVAPEVDVAEYHVTAGCFCGGELFLGKTSIIELQGNDQVATVPVPDLPAEAFCKCGANVMAIYKEGLAFPKHSGFHSSPVIQEVGTYDPAHRRLGAWTDA